MCWLKKKNKHGVIPADLVKVEPDLPSQTFIKFDKDKKIVIPLNDITAFTLCAEPTEETRRLIESDGFMLVSISADGKYYYEKRGYRFVNNFC